MHNVLDISTHMPVTSLAEQLLEMLSVTAKKGTVPCHVFDRVTPIFSWHQWVFFSPLVPCAFSFLYLFCPPIHIFFLCAFCSFPLLSSPPSFSPPSPFFCALITNYIVSISTSFRNVFWRKTSGMNQILHKDAIMKPMFFLQKHSCIIQRNILHGSSRN